MFYRAALATSLSELLALLFENTNMVAQLIPSSD